MNLIELMEADGRTKVASCKCGAGYVLACRMPMAETEKDVVKDFAKYAKKGRRIEYKYPGDVWHLCSCLNMPATVEAPVLAPVVADPNQLALFPS